MARVRSCLGGQNASSTKLPSFTQFTLHQAFLVGASGRQEKQNPPLAILILNFDCHRAREDATDDDVARISAVCWDSVICG